MLELISSKRYLISTNGRHSHPDLGTIAKILKANSDAEIITNYHHEKLNIFKSIVESKKLKAKFILASEIIVE